MASARDRILDAVRVCCERWGIERTTIDDIARESGVSRATLYRLFPGGKEVLFEQHREQELREFIDRVIQQVDGIDDLHQLVARLVSVSTLELRHDEHLALMMASEPGAVAAEITVQGMPQTIAIATQFLAPLIEPHLEPADGWLLIDLLVRVVLSYFLAPSDLIDLADEQQAYAFVAPFIEAVANRSTSTPTGDPS